MYLILISFSAQFYEVKNCYPLKTEEENKHREVLPKQSSWQVVVLRFNPGSFIRAYCPNYDSPLAPSLMILEA
jgi:hypothetical protein